MSGLDALTREELIVLLLALDETVQRQAERISELEEEVARLRGSKSSAGLCIKPSIPKKDKTPRKKRKHSFARERLPATQVCYHAVDICPDCDRKLSGGSIKWYHQVIDIPPLKAEVVDHIFVERWCGVCGKRWTPDSGEVLGEVVVGKKTIGIGLMSMIAHLKVSCRVPIGLLQGLLQTAFGVSISRGEIAEILHDVAEVGESPYKGLLSRIRGSPVVHGDETGWREDGKNGYLWSFSTPDVRYYEYRKSRGSVVVEEVLSGGFAGSLVTDFYAAYNIYDGLKQRCWVHLLRDLRQLVEKNPDKPEISGWVDAVGHIYRRAKEAAGGKHNDAERCVLRQGFESELLELARPYIGVKSAPERVLAERMQRFIGELFTFVQYPNVPSENNAAERAIRPAVVARKISGGTRSPKGSKTNSILRSLFETWALQGQNTLTACRQMLVDYNRKAQPATT